MKRKQSVMGMGWLQRGRAFWGAEIIILVGLRVFTGTLQRGRAFWGAEIHQRLERAERQGIASTGPRLLGRGDEQMRPVSAPVREKLQRGRAFWGAEIWR